MRPQALTDHQAKVLEYIKEFQGKRGYSPSLADLAIAFGLRSKNAIAKVVNVLTRARFLEKDPKGRIKILERETSNEKRATPLTLPLFGPIAAGFAAPVEEQAEERIVLENFLVRDPVRTFLLKVKGDSMTGAGIFDGDIVIVERTSTLQHAQGRTEDTRSATGSVQARAEPKVSDIVVGIVDGEFTLKRLAKEKGKHYLHAENPAYPDIFALEELEVAGVVRGVVRKLT